MKKGIYKSEFIKVLDCSRLSDEQISEQARILEMRFSSAMAIECTYDKFRELFNVLKDLNEIMEELRRRGFPAVNNPSSKWVNPLQNN